MAVLAAAVALQWRCWGHSRSVLAPGTLFLCCYGLFMVPGDMAVALEAGSIRPIVVPITSLFAFALASVLVSPAVMTRRLGIGRASGIQLFRDAGVAWAFFGVMVVGFGAVVAYYALIGVVPLWHGVRAIVSPEAAAVSMHELRRQITPGHRFGNVPYIGQGYFRAIYFNLLPLAVIWFAAKDSLSLGSIRPRTKVLVALAVGVNFLDGRIWMGIQVMALVGFALLHLKLGSRNPRGAAAVGRLLRWAGGTTIMLSSVAVAYRYVQHISGRATDNIIETVAARVFLLPSGRLYMLFPEPYRFRWGGTWVSDMMGFLPGTRQSFAYEVHQIVYGSGWGFTLSPTMIGAAWVNFGYMGTLCMVPLLAVLVGLTYRSLEDVPGASGIVLRTGFATGVGFSALGDLTSLVMTYAVLGITTGIMVAGTVLQRSVGGTKLLRGAPSWSQPSAQRDHP